MNKSANYTLITVAINLLIAAILAYWLLTGSVNPLQDFIQFLQDFKLNFIVAFFSLIVSGVFFGRKMGYLICQKNRNAILIGIIGMLLILICGILGGSTVGFIAEGLQNNYSLYDDVLDYYFKPFFWIFMTGFLPTIISGAILGSIIHENCNKR